MATDMDVLNALSRVVFGQTVPMRSIEVAESMEKSPFRSSLMDAGLGGLLDIELTCRAARIGRVASRHVRQTPNGQRVVVGTASRGWLPGPRIHSLIPIVAPEFRRPATSQFIGLSGEFAVISELLAADWNATKLPHDNGIDIIAYRDQKLRTVQVKTSHGCGPRGASFKFNLDRRADDLYGALEHYYILVMRRLQPERYLNDFLIIPSIEMRRMLQMGPDRPESTHWVVTVTTADGKWTLNNYVDVTRFLNNFGQNFR